VDAASKSAVEIKKLWKYVNTNLSNVKARL
jgi:hypothetical protein